MSVTSGFFNSLNGDRTYNAEQMSAIFDGIINDGVFMSIGTAFAVYANSGMVVNVGIGRAWFNSTWILNDAILPLSVEESEILLDRYDAVVIEVDHSESVRAATIKIIEGTPSSSPSYPDMEDDDDVHQYPLAYIYVGAGVTEITDAEITNVIGKTATPYVTGILETLSIDSIVAKWESQWANWFSNETDEDETEFTDWLATKSAEYAAWFESLSALLEDDAATSLASAIVDIQEDLRTLKEEQTLYDTVEDSDDDTIEDSYESDITGRIIYVIK